MSMPTEKNLTKKPKILVVDDDPNILNAFEATFYGRKDASLHLYSSPKEALSVLSENPFLFALAFVDYRFAQEGPPIGHELAKQLKTLNPYLCVCLMSGDQSPEALEKWLRAGVDKFMYKPLGRDFINCMISYAIDTFHAQFSGSFSYDSQKINIKNVQEKIGLVGVSENIQHVIHQTIRFASTKESVLILGETGTGKEIVAQAIHKASPRAKEPFVVVNCAAITDTLFESEFFGHIKGAFTGANANKRGKFELAHRGTLFLDEIHHLTLNQQAKILRVIQEKKILPVGGSKEIPVDFRLVSASKPDLESKSEKKEFLADLYYRISTLDIHIVPLKDRPEDIKPLVHFFQAKNLQENLPRKMFLPVTMDLLRKCLWQGNVRELEKLIRKLSITVEGPSVHPKHLPSKFQKQIESSLEQQKMKAFVENTDIQNSQIQSQSQATKVAESTETYEELQDEVHSSMKYLHEEEQGAVQETLSDNSSSDWDPSFWDSSEEESSLSKEFDAFEKKQHQEMGDFILYLLQKTGNNIARAARLMGVSRTTLNSRIKTFNLQDKIKRF